MEKGKKSKADEVWEAYLDMARYDLRIYKAKASFLDAAGFKAEAARVRNVVTSLSSMCGGA